MLHAKDLMIGDFLRYKQDFPRTHHQGKIVKVLGIKGRLDVRTIDDGNFHESEHPDWFEPISLTPEILKKNGFKDSEFFGELLYKDWQIMSDCEHLAARCRDGWNFDIPCKFVHELQNALRLCGIEKEIEL